MERLVVSVAATAAAWCDGYYCAEEWGREVCSAAAPLLVASLEELLQARPEVAHAEGRRGKQSHAEGDCHAANDDELEVGKDGQGG